MKKTILLLMLLFTKFSFAFSQSYNELDLIGTWNVVEHFGSYSYYYYSSLKIEGINKLYFKNSSVYNENEYGEYTLGRIEGSSWANYKIGDFYISGSMILHIKLNSNKSHMNLKFKINSLKNNRLELSTLDDACTLIFEKESSGSYVNSLEENDDENGKYYNVQGMKEDDQPQNGVNIIRYNDGTTKKVVVR